jgi:hypothetical protein
MMQFSQVGQVPPHWHVMLGGQAPESEHLTRQAAGLVPTNTHAAPCAQAVFAHALSVPEAQASTHSDGVSKLFALPPQPP